MSAEVMNLVITIEASLIMILLGVVGYFARQIPRAIKGLESTANALQVSVEVQKSELRGMKEVNNTNHTELNKQIEDQKQRLNNHSNRLINHNERITVLESKH